MVLGTGFLLLVSLLVNSALTTVSAAARVTAGNSPVFLHAVNALGSFTVNTGFFAMNVRPRHTPAAQRG